MYYFCQAEDGIRDAHEGLEFRRVLFRSDRKSRRGGGMACRSCGFGFEQPEFAAGLAQRHAVGERPGEAKRKPYGSHRGHRKSVVQRTSVSVRVDLGGRRIIKKTTNTQTGKTT